MPQRIVITERENFVFNFVRNNEGKGIPLPLPQTIRSLAKKGLVETGEFLPVSHQMRCWLTPLGKRCIQLKKG